ncbi:MAG: hypothetical protein QXP59_07780 [Saccharolobus sp.]
MLISPVNIATIHAAGDKYPGKGGLGIFEIVINKIDLAPYVNADLEKMRRDAIRVRKNKPFVFISLKTGEGLRELATFGYSSP